MVDTPAKAPILTKQDIDDAVQGCIDGPATAEEKAQQIMNMVEEWLAMSGTHIARSAKLPWLQLTLNAQDIIEGKEPRTKLVKL